jgi:hypothetical protein
LSARKIHADGFDLEDQREAGRIFKIKNLQAPAKRGMKAFDESAQKWFGRLAPSFSLRRSASSRSKPTSAIKPVS